MTALKNTQPDCRTRKTGDSAIKARNKGLGVAGLYFKDIMSVVVRSLYSKQESGQTKHVRHSNIADSVLSPYEGI